MKVENNKIRLKSSEWNFKVNNKGRRMKIYIKLTQEESARWHEIKNAVTGGAVGGQNVADDEFAKIMLFRGLNAFMDDIHSALDEMDDSEKQKLLEEAGVEGTVDVALPNIQNLGPTSDINDESNKDAS